MEVYGVPKDKTNWRKFRMLAWSGIMLLLGICIVSVYDPVGLGDPARRVLASIAGAIVLGIVVLATVLPSRRRIKELKEGLEFELANGKITQMRSGQLEAEMCLDQIESARDYRGWLIISGGEPEKQITIPSEASGFEELKQAVAAYRQITPLKRKVRWISFLPFIVLVLALFFLFGSHRRSVVLAAGGALLALQGLSFYSVLEKMPRRRLALLLYAVAWLAMAWIVYRRAVGAF